MAVRKIPRSRREAMGGLAKGIAVIRAFSREHPRPPSATSRAAPDSGRHGAAVSAHARGSRLRHPLRPQLSPAAEVLELGAAYLDSMDIEHLTKTHLEELARKTGDSAAMCVLDGTDIVYVARASVRTLPAARSACRQPFPRLCDFNGPGSPRGPGSERLQHYFDTAQLEALTEHTVGSRTNARAHRRVPAQWLCGGRR